MSLRLEPGVRLSGHLLSAEIGQGGFSRVFRAEPVCGGKAVAIKVAIQPELVAALRTEGAVLRRLHGPRFVEILEEHLDEDPPYFVLELCLGGDLRAFLEKRPGRRLSPSEAERVMTAILEGCAFMHDEGVVHGDLKPENVLLTENRGEEPGEPKIADLGLSRAHRRKLKIGDGVQDSLTTEGDGKVRGTFDYLAPETRKGSDISPASDVYALGVLFYELLTGRRPLGVFQLPRAALAKEGIEVSVALDRVVGRALAHDTSERYPDASIMLQDLRAGEQPLAWTHESAPAATGPKLVLSRPVNDLSFVLQLYTAVVVPVTIFALAFATVRSQVDSRALRLLVLAVSLVLACWLGLRAFLARPERERAT